MHATKRPIVFFDIEVGRAKIGRLKMQLWNDRMPKTAQNFRQLCTGQYIKNKKPTGYKETCFYQVTEQEIRGGDYRKNDGSGGESTYGEPFIEKSEQKVGEDAPWILSMVKDLSSKKCSSVFQISRQWKSYHLTELVPFGEIHDQPSIKVLKALLEIPTNESKKPRVPIIIYECGEM